MDNEHKEQDVLSKQAISENIEKFGCHIVLIEADNYLPAFAYTIGLHQKYNHPEIICFGLSTETLGSLLNFAKDLVRRGYILESGLSYKEFIKGYNVQFLEVDKAFYPDYLGYADWFYDYETDFSVLQLIWPDKRNKYPWDEDFTSEWSRLQPLLDRNVDFKFQEGRNLGVYTTKQVLEGEPILYVYHNEDGDWQFHSLENPNIDDARLVSLEEITIIDPSVNTIFFLQYGWKAWRNTIKDAWSYEEDID